MMTHPEKVLEACEALMPHLYHVALTSADPNKQVPIGYWMHRGYIPFVSEGQFESHYWPTVKPIIEVSLDGGYIMDASVIYPKRCNYRKRSCSDRFYPQIQSLFGEFAKYSGSAYSFRSGLRNERSYEFESKARFMLSMGRKRERNSVNLRQPKTRSGNMGGRGFIR
jgi:hypothetical protein